MIGFLGGEAAYAELRDTALRDGIADFVTPWGDDHGLGFYSDNEDVAGVTVTRTVAFFRSVWE